ncbi:MAG: type I secretion system permease/ATPase, partial [Micavibrio aeruginosavorus]|nr:type I secretion system permease/ATPase [Micavibrio aeruginosavorus]
MAAQQSASSRAPGDAENPWPLQADRVALHSPLVDCLRILAGHYGRRTSAASLTAGLPVPATGITPALFVRAAERADLNARLIERAIEALAIAPILPCILVLEHGHACILWDIKYPPKHPPKKEAGKDIEIHPETQFVVQFPETEDEKKIVPLDRMRGLYSGYAFYLRPVARVDERAGPATIDTARDWFWAALKEHKRIYKEVIIAAVMINLFALASPLFTMNVYDRVVPNSAFDTLWVLSAGVVTVFIFDFVLKNLRARFLDYAGRKADIKMSAALFEQLMGMTMAARPASAGVLASNVKEFEGLRDFFTSATLTALIDLPFAILFVVLIAVIAGPVALVPLLAMPIVVVMGFALQKPLARVIKESMNESALKNALLFETISGLETIKVQAAEGHTQRKWEELNEKSSRTAMKSREIAAFALNFAMLIQQIASVLIVIVGVYLISEGMITMGALIASVMLGGRALAPLAQVAGLMTRMNQSRQALTQLEELMKRPVERPAGKHFISMPDVRGHEFPSQFLPEELLEGEGDAGAGGDEMEVFLPKLLRALARDVHV